MKSTTQETYREQLLRMARSLAAADGNAVMGDLSADSRALGVKLFIDGNLDKRFEKLKNSLEFVAEAFDDFDALVEDYVRSSTLAAYDTGASDGERMTEWLRRTQSLTPEQGDYLACQEARHRVEVLARDRRLEYARFRERWSVTPAVLEDCLDDGALAAQLHVWLNPIRVWKTFHTTALVGDDADPPCRVLFFPVEGEISTALLEPDGQQSVEQLASLSPCRLEDWLAEDRLEILHDLAEMGLVAVY